jgi:hypothetical protein
MLQRRNHGSGHSYTLDGEKVRGVTTILKVASKDALIEWAARTTADYALDNWEELAALRLSERRRRMMRARFDDRDAAARKGTQVHKLGADLAAGREVQVPEQLAGHVAAYARFLDGFDVELTAGPELVLANREVRYCGTADLVAEISGEVWLLDLKTSRSGVFPETALQLEAYRRGDFYVLASDLAEGREHPMESLGITRTGAVHITADGCELRPTDGDPDGAWAYFRHLAWLHAHELDQKEWVGDMVDPPLWPAGAATLRPA